MHKGVHGIAAKVTQDAGADILLSGAKARGPVQIRRHGIVFGAGDTDPATVCRRLKRGPRCGELAANRYGKPCPRFHFIRNTVVIGISVGIVANAVVISIAEFIRIQRKRIGVVTDTIGVGIELLARVVRQCVGVVAGAVTIAVSGFSRIVWKGIVDVIDAVVVIVRIDAVADAIAVNIVD